MRHLVEVPLDDKSGDVIYVEVEGEPPDSGTTRVANVGEVIHKTKQTLEEALNSIKPAIRLVTSSFLEINNPEEIEVEFGIVFKTEAGIVFSSAALESNFKVTLKWNRGPKKDA